MQYSSTGTPGDTAQRGNILANHPAYALLRSVVQIVQIPFWREKVSGEGILFFTSKFLNKEMAEK